MKSETTPLTNCDRRDELLDYLYDEMTTVQQTAFRQHLDTCAICTEELHGLQRLRTDLRAWDAVTAPALEIVIPRSPWDALKECFALLPLWGRGAFALSSACALLLMTFGVVSLMRGTPTGGAATGNNLANATATPAPATTQTQSTQTVSLSPEIKAQVQAQVAEAVAQAVEQERQAFRTQLAGFETRNAEQQMRIQTALRQLHTLQTRHEAMLAEQQPSLRRMMMAEYSDPTGER